METKETGDQKLSDWSSVPNETYWYIERERNFAHHLSELPVVDERMWIFIQKSGSLCSEANPIQLSNCNGEARFSGEVDEIGWLFSFLLKVCLSEIYNFILISCELYNFMSFSFCLYNFMSTTALSNYEF